MKERQSAYTFSETYGIGIQNPQSCSRITKSDSMSEADFRAVVSLWAGRSDFKLIEGKFLYVTEEEAQDFFKFIDSTNNLKEE